MDFANHERPKKRKSKSPSAPILPVSPPLPSPSRLLTDKSNSGDWDSLWPKNSEPILPGSRVIDIRDDVAPLTIYEVRRMNPGGMATIVVVECGFKSGFAGVQRQVELRYLEVAPPEVTEEERKILFGGDGASVNDRNDRNSQNDRNDREVGNLDFDLSPEMWKRKLEINRDWESGDGQWEQKRRAVEGDGDVRLKEFSSRELGLDHFGCGPDNKVRDERVGE